MDTSAACRMVLALATAASVACASSGPAQTAAQQARTGREIFFTECYGCHTLGVAGTPIAPDLSTIGARLSREEIERRLRDPRTHEPSARMPKLDLRDDEIRALAQYLSGLR